MLRKTYRMPTSTIWGKPYIDLEPYLDTSRFHELDDEICFALTEVRVEYTGGSHRTLGIVPRSFAASPYIDYGDVIRGFKMEEFAVFASLSDTPRAFDLERYRDYEFGEEK